VSAVKKVTRIIDLGDGTEPAPEAPRQIPTDLDESIIQHTMMVLRKKVTIEILNHKNWCSHTCQTFSASVYRQARMDGHSREKVQGDYDMCHASR
jgi:hypothetical protein